MKFSDWHQSLSPNIKLFKLCGCDDIVNLRHSEINILKEHPINIEFVIYCSCTKLICNIFSQMHRNQYQLQTDFGVLFSFRTKITDIETIKNHIDLAIEKAKLLNVYS